jgi:hypothetical protein
MRTYACRECGATDGFEHVQMVFRTFYVADIYREGGKLRANYEDDSEDASGDPEDIGWQCGHCDAQADTLDQLVTLVRTVA